MSALLIAAVIVFVLNNGGYLIERALEENPDWTYNDLAPWNYAELPKALNRFVPDFVVNWTTPPPERPSSAAYVLVDRLNSCTDSTGGSKIRIGTPIRRFCAVPPSIR